MSTAAASIPPVALIGGAPRLQVAFSDPVSWEVPVLGAVDGLGLPAWAVVALAVLAVAVLVVARAERRLRHRIARLARRAEEAEEALERIEEALVARHREGREVASGRLLAAVRTAQRPRPSGARDLLGRDLFAWRALGEPAHGTYAEIGAGDGERDAPTWLFESLGWRGLLVEADPKQAARAQVARPGSSVLARAITGPEGPGHVTFHAVEGGRDEPGFGPTAGLGFTRPSAAALAPVIAAGARTRPFEVEASTLDAALTQVGIDARLDLLLVDFLPGAADVLASLGPREEPRLVLVAGAGEVVRDDLGEEDERARVRAVAQAARYVLAGRYADHIVLVASDAGEVLRRVREDAGLCEAF